MKHLSRMTIAATVLTFSQLAYAAEFWSDETSVTQLYPHADGLTFVVQYSNPLSTCGGTRWVIPLNAPNYKVLAATLMLAYAQSQRIQFHVNNQPATCEPAVDRFIVLR
jgi:hypothetical protein